MRMRVCTSALVLAVLVAGWPARADGLQWGWRGEILSLVGVGAGQPGDPIRVTSSVRAIDRIPVSNLYYVIRAPSGAVVATRTRFLGRLNAGEVANDSWSTSNTPETGTYTVSLCWSLGAQRNCGIDYAETSFYSVPTLGAGLSVLALAMVAVWLWRQRKELAPRSA